MPIFPKLLKNIIQTSLPLIHHIFITFYLYLFLSLFPFSSFITHSLSHLCRFFIIASLSFPLFIFNGISITIIIDSINSVLFGPRQNANFAPYLENSVGFLEVREKAQFVIFPQIFSAKISCYLLR